MFLAVLPRLPLSQLDWNELFAKELGAGPGRLLQFLPDIDAKHCPRISRYFDHRTDTSADTKVEA